MQPKPADEAGTASEQRWAEGHRQIPLRPVLRALERVLGWRLGGWLGREVVLPLERRINRWWVPSPPAPRAPAPADPAPRSA